MIIKEESFIIKAFRLYPILILFVSTIIGLVSNKSFSNALNSYGKSKLPSVRKLNDAIKSFFSLILGYTILNTGSSLVPGKVPQFKPVKYGFWGLSYICLIAGVVTFLTIFIKGWADRSSDLTIDESNTDDTNTFYYITLYLYSQVSFCIFIIGVLICEIFLFRGESHVKRLGAIGGIGANKFANLSGKVATMGANLHTFAKKKVQGFDTLAAKGLVAANAKVASAFPSFKRPAAPTSKEPDHHPPSNPKSRSWYNPFNDGTSIKGDILSDLGYRSGRVHSTGGIPGLIEKDVVSNVLSSLPSLPSLF